MGVPMTILALGTYYGHLVHMMPLLEGFRRSRSLRVVYAATMEAADIPFERFFSTAVMETFLEKERIVTGRPGYWGSDLLLLVRDLKPDVIFWWNGLAYGSLVRNILVEHLPVFWCEMGFLPQRGHLYVDHLGINALSSIRLLPNRDLTEREDRTLSDVLARFERITMRERGEILPDPPYLFVPLQSEIDTQITRFSPHCTTMHGLVDRVLAAFPEWRIVVKPHPVQPSVSLPSSPRLILSSAPTAALIAGADAVVGINSTVLTEAVAAGKRVAALGRGVFTGRDVVVECDRDPRVLPTVLTTAPDLWARRSWLHDLLCLAQIRTADPDDQGIIPQYDPDPDEVEDLWRRVVEPHLFSPRPVTPATLLRYRGSRILEMIRSRSLSNRV